MGDKELFVKMVTDNWQGKVRAVNHLLGQLSDEQLVAEIAPGMNRGIYLLGHLIAVSDLMLPLLRFEESLFPELQSVYVDSPDRSITATPSVAELRVKWSEINERLNYHFNKLSAEDWFTRHDIVSEKEFIEQPHRNRLNALMGRTLHLGYHQGQLALLLQKGIM
jgi:hypothetical protein